MPYAEAEAFGSAVASDVVLDTSNSLELELFLDHDLHGAKQEQAQARHDGE